MTTPPRNTQYWAFLASIIALVLGAGGTGTGLYALRNTDDRFRGSQAVEMVKAIEKNESEIDTHKNNHPDRNLGERIHSIDSKHREKIFALERRLIALELRVLDRENEKKGAPFEMKGFGETQKKMAAPFEKESLGKKVTSQVYNGEPKN